MKSLTPRSSSLLFFLSVAGDAGALVPGRESRPLSSWLRPSSRSFSYSPLNKPLEEDGRNVKVAVWWDLVNCNIPVGVNAFRVAQRITSALRSSGIKGPVTITAFGDMSQLSRASQEALVSTGVCLNHVPCGGKNSSDKFFMAELLYWVQQNPPPAHLFLISGNRDVANTLHRLRMCNYNILLACKGAAPGVLCSAATMMWSWPCLLKGENADIKHFNHPPDGPYGSWYGHHKAVFHDPFFDVNQSSNLREEIVKLVSEAKPRPIPKAFVDAIRQILYSYPEGINMSKLGVELRKMNVTIEKDLFGYKNFFHLLSSMPGVIKFLPNASTEGQPLVVGTHKIIADSPPLIIKPIQDVDASDEVKNHTPKQNVNPLLVKPTSSNELDAASTICKTPLGQKKTISDSDKHMSIHTQEQVTVDEGLFKRIKQTGFPHGKAVNVSSSKANDMEANHYVSSSEQRKNVEVGRGFLQMIWRAWNGPVAGRLTGEFDTIPGLSLEDSGKAKSICTTTEKSGLEGKAAKNVSSRKANDMVADHYISSPEQRKNIEVERGFLQMIWRAWNGPVAGRLTGEIDTISGISLEDSGKAKSIHTTTENSELEGKAAKNVSSSKANDMVADHYISSPEQGKNIEVERGFLQMIWRAWNGPVAGRLTGEIDTISGISLEDSGKAKSIHTTTENSELEGKAAKNVSSSKANDMVADHYISSPEQGKNIEVERGFLQMIWRAWNGPVAGRLTGEIDTISGISLEDSGKAKSIHTTKENSELEGKAEKNVSSSKANDMMADHYISSPEQGKNIEVERGFLQRIRRAWNVPVASHLTREIDIISGQSHDDSGKAKSLCTTEKSEFEGKAAMTVSSSNADGVEANHYVSSPEQRKNIEVDRGFLQRIWKAWNGPVVGHLPGEIDTVSGLSVEVSGKAKSICATTEKSELEDKATKLNNNFSNEPSTSPSSLETGKVIDDKENDTSRKSNNDLNSIIQSKPLDPSSKGCIWDTLESFLLTSKGTKSVLRVKTREHLVRLLQKSGPMVLRNLTKDELLEMINSMIVEKKWLKESTSQKFPFKLTLLNKQNGVPSPINSSSNGLSSIFRNGILKSNLQNDVQPDQHSGSSFNQALQDKMPQNFEQLRSWFQKVYKGCEDVEPEALETVFKSTFNTKLVSSIYSHPDLQSLVAACLAHEDYKQKSSPGRKKVLQDCRKLLADLLHENPDGFNMCLFKSSFLTKYGYVLDMQLLGYPKISSLLKIMPGVRIESSVVIPAEKFRSDSSCIKQSVAETLVSDSQDVKGDATDKDSEREGNSEDHAWDELGPVSGTGISKACSMDLVKDGEATYNEVSLSDEVFSDPEGESPPGPKRRQSERGGENSSLIQILDSWYSRKEADEKEQAQESAQIEDASSSKESGEKNQAEAERILVDVKPTKKQKKGMQSKRYNFVAECADKEKMVDSILESLKKAGDSKLHS